MIPEIRCRNELRPGEVFTRRGKGMHTLGCIKFSQGLHDLLRSCRGPNHGVVAYGECVVPKDIAPCLRAEARE